MPMQQMPVQQMPVQQMPVQQMPGAPLSNAGVYSATYTAPQVVPNTSTTVSAPKPTTTTTAAVPQPSTNTATAGAATATSTSTATAGAAQQPSTSTATTGAAQQPSTSTATAGAKSGATTTGTSTTGTSASGPATASKGGPVPSGGTPASAVVADELVISDDGMPFSGLASTTTFTDASKTACGNRWRGTYKTADGQCGRNYTMHGPLSTISAFWWDKRFKEVPWVENADGTGKCDTPGFELCYELTPVKSGASKFAGDPLPPPLVVKVGDRCGDKGWCDGTNDTPGSTTGRDYSVSEAVNSKTAWTIDEATRMHFDIMAGSIPMDNPWSNYNYNKNTTGNWNFLVRFKRVDCAQHMKVPSGTDQYAPGCECTPGQCTDFCKDEIGNDCKRS